MIKLLGAILISILGFLSGLVIWMSMKKFSKGKVRNLFKWIFITVMFTGFPFAVWNVLLESHLFFIEDPIIRELPGMLLVTLFFVFMLKTAIVGKGIANEFSFTAETERMKEAMKEK